MTQYNENVICFVGDEAHARSVLLTLARNYEKSETRLAEEGLTYEYPGLAGLSDRVAERGSIPDMVGELDQVCWDPLYALDPQSDVSVGGDYLPEEAVACEKVKAADGIALYRLTMSFFSYGGLALDALAEFAGSLPPDRYAIAAAYKWEYDDSVYANLGNEVDGGEYDYTPGHDRYGLFQPDEAWEAGEVRELVSSLREEGDSPSAETLAMEPVVEAMASWFGIDFKARDRTVRERKRAGVDPALLRIARHMPITFPIEGTHHAGRIPRIEHVHVGDQVVLQSDWENKWYTPVAIEVFNLDGGSLGNLVDNEGSYSWQESSDFSDNTLAYEKGLTHLAYLLPYTRATVASVTPLSKRRGGAKYALMDVRIELEPGVLSDDGEEISPKVAEAVARLSRRRRANRVTASEHPEGWAANRTGRTKPKASGARGAKAPKGDAEGEAEKRLQKMASGFPVSTQVDGTSVSGRPQHIEGLRVGDPLVLRMRIGPGNVVAIEVFNLAGEDLGSLHRSRELRALGNEGTLESLLPYVSASVESVTPVSKRRGNAMNALLKVKMELVPGVFDPKSSTMSRDVLDAIAQASKQAKRARTVNRLVESWRPGDTG